MEYPQTQVEIWNASSSKLSARLNLEAESPKGLEADLVWAAAPSYYIDLIEKDLIYAYDSPEGKEINSKFKDPQNRYFSGRLISVVIVYNNKQITDEEAPKNWEDLMSPEWRDRLIMPDARRSGTALAWVTALSSKYGWEIFQALNNNNIAIGAKNSVVINKIVQGEYPVGVSLDYMARNEIRQGVSLGIKYPEDGAVIIGSPIAITSTGENIESAKLFVDFVLSQKGQETLVKEGSFIPARSDVSFPFNVNPSVIQNIIEVDWKRLSENEIQIKRNYTNIFLD